MATAIVRVASKCLFKKVIPGGRRRRRPSEIIIIIKKVVNGLAHRAEEEGVEQEQPTECVQITIGENF